MIILKVSECSEYALRIPYSQKKSLSLVKGGRDG